MAHTAKDRKDKERDQSQVAKKAPKTVLPGTGLEQVAKARARTGPRGRWSREARLWARMDPYTRGISQVCLGFKPSGRQRDHEARMAAQTKARETAAMVAQVAPAGLLYDELGDAL